MGSAFKFSWIVFALSVISGIVAFATWSGKVAILSALATQIPLQSPFAYFFLYPLVTAFVLVLATAAMHSKPHMRDTRFRNVVLVGTVVVLFLCQLRNLAHLFGWHSTPANFFQFVGVLAGLLLIVAGNYLPKAVREDSLDLPKPWSYFFSIPWTLPFGYLFGVRTWWTLASDHVWNRTHRLAGRLWIISGIGLAIAPWIPDAVSLSTVVLASLVLNILIPILYSFMIRQTQEPA